jgi:fructosamine-3-kinase
LERATLAAARKLLCHRPKPSLTHGDLWGGNAGFVRASDCGDTHGGIAAAIFDPAAQIADAETDLAMSELFGGFAPAFYRGYFSHPFGRAIDLAAYRRRRTAYNLYHLLNHYNLFGGHYREQAEAAMSEIVGAV